MLSENVLRYHWDRAYDPSLPLDSALVQRCGGFRAWYETDLGQAVDYFFVPKFNADGEVITDYDYPMDRDNPDWKNTPGARRPRIKDH